MKRLLFLSSLVVLVSTLFGCGRGDDFYYVTKEIHIQDSIRIDEPFNFQLVLRNDTLKDAKLTIDQKVQQSLFFSIQFYCSDDILRSEVENPESYDNNYKIHYLKRGDSLTYNLRGTLKTYSRGSLALVIDGYDRVYKLKKPDCDVFKIDFGGMWLPGDFNPFDAMEGYNFRKEIKVIQ